MTQKMSEMYRIRNLLLCNPRSIENYSEDETGTVTVVFANNTSITAKPTDDGNFWISITTRKPFGETCELFRDKTNLSTALFVIHRHMNNTAEDQMFSMFRSIANA